MNPGSWVQSSTTKETWRWLLCPYLPPSDPWWPLHRCHHLERNSGTSPHQKYWYCGFWASFCPLPRRPSVTLSDLHRSECFFRRVFSYAHTRELVESSDPGTSLRSCVLHSVVGTAGSWAQHVHQTWPPGGSWSCSQWNALWRKLETKGLVWSPEKNASPRSLCPGHISLLSDSWCQVLSDSKLYSQRFFSLWQQLSFLRHFSHKLFISPWGNFLWPPI